MRLFGLALIIVSLVVPIFGFIQLSQLHPNTPLFAQYLGVVALIAMAIGQIMATRFAPVEWVFGPLDKTYVLHKWLGIVAVVTMLLHDNVGAKIRGLGPKGAWSDFGEDLGELGMNGILILVGLSLALFIPYRWWRLSHKLTGGFFVLSALHFLMIDKPFGVVDPLGAYVAVFCLLGMASYVITLLPLRLRHAFEYEVAEVGASGEATTIDLRPVGKPMRYCAGQFAFFRFGTSPLRGPHPFTLSSAPSEDGTLRLSVKAVGAITRRLGTTLKVGEIVRVQGPFGRFGSRGGKAPQIWVAGGIGITPFAALIGGLKPDHGPIEIFYTFRGEANAPHLEELRDRVLELPNVTLHTCDTATSGRLDAGQIVGAVGFPIAKARVLFCGPVNLRQELVKGLGAHGVPRRRVHYEEFEIRSDVWPLQFINVPAKTWMAKIGL